jgi:CheY-like chemotaxis protein
MARLLDDLLDVGRITSDKLELRRQRVDLATVIRDAVEMSGPLFQGFAHELAVSLPDGPILLDADPARLGQVFGNLFNNACRYTDPHGRITVVVEQHGDDAVVTVRDTGIGIPEDKLASIFDMFSQLDRSLERPQSGLGIGLHLVKRLVEMHGGTVQAQSAGMGHGSEFVVRLPALPMSSALESQPAAPEWPSQPQKVKGRRILVVDDNVDNAESLALLLEMDGHETSTAHDGSAAISRAEQIRPDVVLLDLGLPIMSGFDACRHIREQPWGKAMVLIAITGWGQDVDRRMSREAGFDHHLVKPVDTRDITAILARPSEAAPGSLMK